MDTEVHEPGAGYRETAKRKISSRKTLFLPPFHKRPPRNTMTRAALAGSRGAESYREGGVDESLPGRDEAPQGIPASERPRDEAESKRPRGEAHEGQRVQLSDIGKLDRPKESKKSEEDPVTPGPFRALRDPGKQGARRRQASPPYEQNTRPRRFVKPPKRYGFEDEND